MYRDEPNERDGTRISEKDRVLAWTKDVADSIADEAPRSTVQAPHSKARHAEREPPKVVVNQIMTSPAVVVTRVRPESTPKDDDIKTKAIIGTVLGATAGAVVAYAMTKSQIETLRVEQQKRITTRTIEAPVTYDPIQADKDSHVREFSRASSKSFHHAIAASPLPRSYIDDLLSQSERSHHFSRSATRSHVEGVTSPPSFTKISVADSGNSKASHASSHGKTARWSNLIPITEVRSAKDVPLPYSRVTSLASEEREESKAGNCLKSPKESVSQMTTRRLGESGRSKHCGGRDLGSGSDHEHGFQRPRTLKRSREQR